MRYDHEGLLPERAFSPVGRRMTLEGGSSSKSSSASTSTTNNVDRRIVADGGSSVFAPDIHLSGGSVSVTNIDPALIKATSDALAQTQENLRVGYSDLSAVYLSLLQENTKQNDQLQQNVLRVIDATGEQYSDASQTAAGNKPLIYAGLLIAGVVALGAMRAA